MKHILTIAAAALAIGAAPASAQILGGSGGGTLGGTLGGITRGPIGGIDNSSSGVFRGEWSARASRSSAGIGAAPRPSASAIRPATNGTANDVPRTRTSRPPGAAAAMSAPGPA